MRPDIDLELAVELFCGDFYYRYLAAVVGGSSSTGSTESDKQRVAIESETVDLRPREYDVITVLISHQSEALSPEQLIDLAACTTGVGWLRTG